MTAENPILITGYAGRRANASRAIEALAQFAGIAVYEFNATNNISHDNPCFVGFTAEKAVPQADVGLLVDVDVPWFPNKVQSGAELVLGAYRRRYAQARLADVELPRQLAHAGRQRTDPRASARGLESESDAALSRKRQPRGCRASKRRATSVSHRAAKLAADKGKPGAINPHYLTSELGKLLDDEDMIFNEGITNAAAVFLQIPRRVPNTIVVAGGGGLGWSGGMALGAKLAAPDRLMVQISGDGGFYFGNPTSVFAIAQQYKLPYPLDRARQFRLERGEAIDAAGLSGRRSQDRQ